MTASAQPQAESVHLYLTDATSDKEYVMSLVPKGEGWVFNYAYGKRGAKLKEGTKTPTPVAYDVAKAEYDRQLKAQLAKRYTTHEDGKTIAGNPQADRLTDLLPQLLNPVSQEDSATIESMLSDPEWVAQQKHNGERRMVKVGVLGDLVATNRLGQTIDLPEGKAHAMAHALGAQLTGGCVLDGEDMKDHVVVFDLLELNGKNLRTKPYSHRLAELEKLLGTQPEDSVFRAVKTAHSASDKRALMEQVRAAQGEGVVFKKKASPHTANRPASGGPQIKVKFLETATCRVRALSSTKRSVEVEMRASDGSARAMGKVSVPANEPMPAVGDLVEVEYLYVVKGGAFTQPTYEKLRPDQTWDANCGVEQLKEVESRAKVQPRRPRAA